MLAPSGAGMLILRVRLFGAELAERTVRGHAVASNLLAMEPTRKVRASPAVRPDNAGSVGGRDADP